MYFMLHSRLRISHYLMFQILSKSVSYYLVSQTLFYFSYFLGGNFLLFTPYFTFLFLEQILEWSSLFVLKKSFLWLSHSGLIWNMCHFISVFTFLFFFSFTLTAACRWQQLKGDNRNGGPRPCCPCSLHSKRRKTVSTQNRAHTFEDSNAGGN